MGGIKVWHFRYHPDAIERDSWDDDKNTMCEWHMQQQNLFRKEWQEVPIENHRADVLFGDDKKVAVEFQHSQLSMSEIEERTEFYIKHCGAIVWVIDYNNVDCEIISRNGGLIRYEPSTRAIIGGIRLRPCEELFIHIGENQYVHVNKHEESWKWFEGFVLSQQFFIQYIKLVADRARGVLSMWDARDSLLRSNQKYKDVVFDLTDEMRESVEGMLNLERVDLERNTRVNETMSMIESILKEASSKANTLITNHYEHITDCILVDVFDNLAFWFENHTEEYVEQNHRKITQRILMDAKRTIAKLIPINDVISEAHMMSVFSEKET